jgi:exodeoxyribonuclease V alpha subunit
MTLVGGTGKEGEQVTGLYAVERVTFNNADTGYAVVYLVPADRARAVGFVAVGLLGQVRTGDCYRIEGVWRRDAKHGLQVQLSAAAPEMPRTVAAIERYLAGSSVKGLGPHYAQSLVQHFGEGTFDELQAGGQRLEEVPGIGPVRAQMIRESWAEHQGVHELMINLQGAAGLSPSQAQHIYRQYGRESWLVVSQNPYRLAEEVRGFGFKTCDRIAASLGIAHDAPARLQAGLVHLLNEALAEGHLWCTAGQLLAGASVLLEAPVEALAPQAEALVIQVRVVRTEVMEDGAAVSALYLPEVYHTEQRIAERLAQRLLRPAHQALRLSPEGAAQLLQAQGHAQLTAEQRGAVTSLLNGARLVILTGGPGTGKTTTVRSLLACLEALQVTYALCATTGRASKQLAASTGREAATVHRHLRIGVGGQRETEPLRQTVLIIDESSMLDIWLLEQILSRLQEDTHLVLVGDVDQLPAVGPGAVLQDLIALGEKAPDAGIRVTRLTQIFRQEAGQRSLIVLNCHRVRAGERPWREPSGEGAPPSDYYEMFRDTPQEARDLAVSLAAERLPRFLDVPPSEVQVLAPMHSGEAGIRALNLALQQALNPPSPQKTEVTFSGVGRSAEHKRILREGDKVRQTRNNYQKQVLNGDLGVITRIDLEEKTLTVYYEDRSVLYTLDELDEIVHSWAMTVHAAQGSQWPAVVIIMLTNHYVMLERNILYTALSRAQRLAVLISQEQAVRLAVAQDRSTRRRTNLVAQLQAALSQAKGPRHPLPRPGRLPI